MRYQDDFYWHDHDFRPAPAGWRVIEMFRSPTGEVEHVETPLAGWTIQVQRDRLDGRPTEPPAFDDSHRRAVPTVWNVHDAWLEVLDESIRSDNAWLAVLGPGQLLDLEALARLLDERIASREAHPSRTARTVPADR